MSVRSSIPTRITAFFGMLCAASFGLASRKTALHDVPIIGVYGGDAAWAMAAYALVRMCAPRASIDSVMLIAGAMALAVELSQLLDAAWINELRQNSFVALLIGKGFLWSDLAAYLVGILLAALIELFIRRVAHARPEDSNGLSDRNRAG